MSAGVELKDVSVTFGSFFAAKNVNVKIEGGEFFSFLGPSGCGKTTLLRAISGFQEPSEGHVLIDNKDITVKELMKGFIFLLLKKNIH